MKYDLDQKKKELETYSQNLEKLVLERTKDLQISEQRQRALFDYAMDGIVVLDKNGKILNVNNRTCEMHGYSREEMIGTCIWDWEVDQDRAVSTERMKQILAGESLVFETVQMKKDGTHLPLEVSSKAVTIGDEVLVQSFYRDITEKKKTQEFLFQSQKMDSIGALAGGIAHDFNNVLSAILGHAEVVRLFPSLDTRSLRSLQVIEDASRKAGAMITKLLGYARKNNAELLPVNLNNIIYDALKILERSLRKNIDLKLDLNGELPLVRADFNQFEQVIMNLIINAQDAMPDGGRLEITTRCMEVVAGMPDVPPYILKGEYVLMYVKDTGCGMSQEVMKNIYEPFFTTKERGKGTGLGLSMVYGTVKEHKGYITVESRTKAGTTFTIYLPSSRTAVAVTSAQVEKIPGGTETILFVDDEEDILSAAQGLLASKGYNVLTSDDPIRGVDIFKDKAKEIKLVITDMVMPKMDGKEVIRQIRLINPDVKILVVSGYTNYVAKKEDIKYVSGFLQKPFESISLLSAVRRILDGQAHGPANS